MFKGLGFKVQGSGVEVFKGLGFRVQGLRCSRV